VDIGKLRSRIQFQSESTVVNAQYSKDRVWTTDFTTWGNIKVNGGMLYSRGDNAEPSTTHIITIRNRSDVVRGMVVLSGGIRYSINRIIQGDPGKIQYLILHCEQLKDQI